MKKTFLSLLATALISLQAIAQEVDSIQLQIQAIEQSLNYQSGVVKLPSGNATLTVPKGFRYLDQQQSMYVLTDLWGNPVDSSVLGMIVPESTGVLSDSGWAFVVSFDELGYVKTTMLKTLTMMSC